MSETKVRGAALAISALEDAAPYLGTRRVAATIVALREMLDAVRAEERAACLADVDAVYERWGNPAIRLFAGDVRRAIQGRGEPLSQGCANTGETQDGARKAGK